MVVNTTLNIDDAWLSLVERCVRDAEVAGSNPVASIERNSPHRKVGTISFYIHVLEVEPAKQWVRRVAICRRQIYSTSCRIDIRIIIPQNSADKNTRKDKYNVSKIFFT